jgi:hypothetical protein
MIPVIRDICEADLNFIINSFLRSLRSYPAVKHVPNEEYYKSQKQLLEHYLLTSVTLVMCNPDDPSHIFGYIIGEPDEDTVFVYVKYTYRKFGFARKLLEALHPGLYHKTLKALYTCRNWETVSAKFRHIHSPYIKRSV